jgi:REP element-mobilizing transposase RayT
MDEGYKIRDQYKPHFVTYTVTDWIDIFTRPIYKDIVIESIKYCQAQKELIVFAFALMSNHLHLIIQSSDGKLSDTIRDMKRHIAIAVLDKIKTEPESRRDWMLKRFAFSANETNTNMNY